MTNRNLSLRVERAVADLRAVVLMTAGQFEKALRDELAERRSTVMCTSGCDACCMHPVYISVLEAIPLYQHLVDRGHWMRIRGAIDKHAAVTWGLAPEIWWMGLLPCPLLSKGLCLGYLSRPLACRATFSAGDPLLCHPHRIGRSVGVVQKSALLARFAEAEKRIFHSGEASFAQLPISKALLLAARVCSGEVEFEGTNAWITREYGKLGYGGNAVCCLCGAERAYAACDVVHLSPEVLAEAKEAGQTLAEEHIYCPSCSLFLKDPVRGANLMKGLIATKLQMRGDPRAETIAQERYDLMLSRVGKSV